MAWLTAMGAFNAISAFCRWGPGSPLLGLCRCRPRLRAVLTTRVGVPARWAGMERRNRGGGQAGRVLTVAQSFNYLSCLFRRWPIVDRLFASTLQAFIFLVVIFRSDLILHMLDSEHGLTTALDFAHLVHFSTELCRRGQPQHHPRTSLCRYRPRGRFLQPLGCGQNVDNGWFGTSDMVVLKEVNQSWCRRGDSAVYVSSHVVLSAERYSTMVYTASRAFSYRLMSVLGHTLVTIM